MTADVLSGWEWASGSVQGREHWLARRNNQDASCVLAGPDALVAVVADGCGSAPHSEVGARLASALLARTLARRAAAARPACRDESAALLGDALDEVLATLEVVAGGRGTDALPWVRDHLLATALGVVVTAERALVFRVGDGVVGVNDAFATHAAPGNTPPYLAYRLLPPECCRLDAAALAPAIEWEGPAESLASVVLATDGAAELRVGESDPHATLRAWLGDDRLYRHPVALGRRLVQLARDEQAIDWDERQLRRRPGVLRDDTSLVLLRRRPAGMPDEDRPHA